MVGDDREEEEERVFCEDNGETDAETCPSSGEDDISEAGPSPHRGTEAEAEGAKEMVAHGQSLACERAGLKAEQHRYTEMSRDAKEVIWVLQEEKARLAAEQDWLQEANRVLNKETQCLAQERASLTTLQREVE